MRGVAKENPILLARGDPVVRGSQSMFPRKRRNGFKAGPGPGSADGPGVQGRGAGLKGAGVTAMLALTALAASAATIQGEIVDAVTLRPVAARLYIQGMDGAWYFATAASTNGSAFRYDRQSGANTNSVEKHVTLSAHPFRVELPRGRYVVTVERGKEYLPLSQWVDVGKGTQNLRLAIRRWVDMADRGWYSGDTHVHRAPDELATVMLAEDVNVVHPMVWWTTVDEVAPLASATSMKVPVGDLRSVVDATHVIPLRNTEYEIFTTARRRHTLGALVILNHRTPFDLPALPLSRVAARARDEGGLLDVEKFNWEWTASMVAVVRPDLFELANNHLWRTEYASRNWAVPAPPWMEVGSGTGSEREWALYGFQTWYMYLNCGFRMAPTASTGHGVHPVPLGFGRVYVHLDGVFREERWMRGLAAGRSFVTTGPMLLATLDGEDPGHSFTGKAGKRFEHRLRGEVLSQEPVPAIEIIRNGEILERRRLESRRRPEGGWEARFKAEVAMEATGWVSVRCWEPRDGGRVRFAHTGAWFIGIGDQPQQPVRREVEYLVSRSRSELERSREVLPAEARLEFERAVSTYEALLPHAR